MLSFFLGGGETYKMMLELLPSEQISVWSNAPAVMSVNKLLDRSLVIS